ncbi:hypothetical protein [Erwinia amylovora]
MYKRQVVQDDFSGALPCGPLPLAALSHLRSTRPAAGSNPARLAHSKKALSGRLSTLVGRAAVSYTHLAAEVILHDPPV